MTRQEGTGYLLKICWSNETVQKSEKADSVLKEFYEYFRDAGAKYVVMPFTSAQEVQNAESSDFRKKKVHNNYALDLEDVEKMFKNTVYSNIPVEVMVTNVEILATDGVVKTEEQHLMKEYKLGDGVYAVPTVKADNKSNSYLAEPIYLVLEYEKYIDYMNRNLDQEGMNVKEAEVAANYLQDFLSSRKNSEE